MSANFFDHVPGSGLVCAHRGARSIAPENTLLALDKARDCGAHCWESDVRLSGDGHLLIFHDDLLERTTDIAIRPQWRGGGPWHLAQLEASQARHLDAGSWFLAADPFGSVASGEVPNTEYGLIRGQRIPLLREILEYTKTHRFPLNLEIKDMKSGPGDVAIVDKVMDMLLATATMDLVLLSSFRHEYLHRARALSRDVSLAVLAEGSHPPDLLSYLRAFAAVAYHPAEDLCDGPLIAELDRAKIRINTWTVNDMDRARALLKAGVGVISDWPQRLI